MNNYLRKVTLGCTGRGAHRWTTVHVIEFTGDVQPGDYVYYLPVARGEYLEVTCPRCRPRPVTKRVGHEGKGARRLRELEQRTRTEGHVREDISDWPF